MDRTELDTEELIRQARLGDPVALGRLLDAYRDILLALAERQLRRRIAARVDASDLIQQTYLEAHRNIGQFVGRREGELHAWLRGILNHNIAGAMRDNLRIAKRDARRERPIDDLRTGVDQPGEWLSSDHTSPSHRAMRIEDLFRLGASLAALPGDQQEAVRLRYLEGLSLVEIAERLGRSRTAAAGLIKRGLQGLRKQLQGSD